MKANKSAALVKMVKSAADAAQRTREVKSKNIQISKEVAVQIEKQLKTNGRTIQVIPIKLIDLGDNIRKFYDEEGIKKLATSLSKDGLIQFPTLALKSEPSGYRLVCRNGHRRILAATQLGWDKIECSILPFESVKEELYHSLNANLRENVFYLDIAEAYVEANALGQADQEIAGRVGLNQRTVRWYRRIGEMPLVCKELIRANPELFNATWAVKLARLGDLPQDKVLEKWMHLMIKMKKTFIREPSPTTNEKAKNAKETALPNKTKVLSSLKNEFKGKAGQKNAKWAHGFLNQLSDCGFIPKNLVTKIEYEIFGETVTDAFYASKN